MLRARSNEIASSVIDGEATLIHLTTRVYYALDGVGAEIWLALQAGTSRDRLIEELAPKYAVSQDAFVTDLDSLLAAMRAENLIEDAEGDPPAPVPLPQTAPLTYVAPVLQRFDDLQEQLALDPPLPMPPRTATR
jgi:hypothetical protein